MAIRLIHLTDPHLTDLSALPRGTLRGKRWSGYLSWRRRRRFVHRRERLDYLTAAVQSLDPVHILVTGDLVHIGLAEEMAVAAEWLQRLGPPERVMLVPGNHDAYARDSWPELSQRWGDYLGVGAGDVADGDGFPTVRDLEGTDGPVRLIGLSSARPSPLFSAGGRLGEGQLERLGGALDVAAWRCVLVHHPPLPGMTTRRKSLGDASALARVLDRHGAELVLHGHLHRNRDVIGAGGVRVMGTASASSVHPQAQRAAAFRCFDLERREGGWRVDMSLHRVREDGGTEVLTRRHWEVTATPPASAASDAR